MHSFSVPCPLYAHWTLAMSNLFNVITSDWLMSKEMSSPSLSIATSWPTVVFTGAVSCTVELVSIKACGTSLTFITFIMKSSVVCSIGFPKSEHLTVILFNPGNKFWATIILFTVIPNFPLASLINSHLKFEWRWVFGGSSPSTAVSSPITFPIVAFSKTTEFDSVTCLGGSFTFCIVIWKVFSSHMGGIPSSVTLIFTAK